TARPGTVPGTGQAAGEAGKPAVREAGKPAVREAGKPAVRGTGKPAAKGAGRPAARSRGNRAGRAGLALTALSIAATAALGLAGPSAMEPVLPGRPGQPPWDIGLHLPPAAAVGLAAAALAAGTAGLGLCLHAVRRGWTVSPRVVLAAGLTAAPGVHPAAPVRSSDSPAHAAYRPAGG